MRYFSTNHQVAPVSFRQAVLEGLPADNGLYLPEYIPQLSQGFFEDYANWPLPQIGFEVARRFAGGEIPDSKLEKITEKAFTFDTPLVLLTENLRVLELFHGPTAAFKDFGARFMARVMGYFVEGENEPLHILVATSGDTGGAVASGFFNVPGIEVTILFPKGKVSPLQQKQLTTWGGNIRALCIEGTFDDCQRMVKQAFLDSDLRSALRMTSANSINISRLIPQSLYYFRARAEIGEISPVFVVPSGNFGNLFGGLMAWKMGLSVCGFLAAVNANAVFPHYLDSGEFKPAPSLQTISNAMDVGNPSNFARIHHLFGGNRMEMLAIVNSRSVSDEKTRRVMKETYARYNYVADPHTAVGLAAWAEHHENDLKPAVVLSTAHPGKFTEVVESVLSNKVKLPASLEQLAHREGQSINMSPEFSELKSYLLD